MSTEGTCKGGRVRSQVEHREGTIPRGSCQTRLVIIGKLNGHDWAWRKGGRQKSDHMMPCARDDSGLTCILVFVKDMLHATEGIVF